MTMILSDNASRVSMHRGESRFRRIATVNNTAKGMERCEHVNPDKLEQGIYSLKGTGHILTVRDNKIVCVDCGAEWQDLGC